MEIERRDVLEQPRTVEVSEGRERRDFFVPLKCGPKAVGIVHGIFRILKKARALMISHELYERRGISLPVHREAFEVLEHGSQAGRTKKRRPGFSSLNSTAVALTTAKGQHLLPTSCRATHAINFLISPAKSSPTFLCGVFQLPGSGRCLRRTALGGDARGAEGVAADLDAHAEPPARRWIMRQASIRFIAFGVSSPVRPEAERKRGALPASQMPAASI